MTDRQDLPESTGEERDLLRLVLDPEGRREWTPEEARAARHRVAADPVLARRLERLRATWEALELPPPAAAPPGFATRVAARARQERRQRLAPWIAWRGAPVWARVAAVLALAAGMASGPLLVTALPGDPLDDSVAGEELATVELVSAEPGLAELYLEALQEEADGAASPEVAP